MLLDSSKKYYLVVYFRFRVRLIEGMGTIVVKVYLFIV